MQVMSGTASSPQMLSRTRSFHLSLYALLIALKKGLHQLVDRKRKRLSVVACSIRLWISFRVVGDFMSMIALIYLG